MNGEKPYENLDKAAAIFLGGPLLVGTILIVLALGSPGSAPNRDQATIIPIAIGLCALGLLGGGGYVYWRLAKQRQNQLEMLARGGAIVLEEPQRTARMIAISFSLADEFFIPPQSMRIQSPVTAGRLSQSVFKEIKRLESLNRMLVSPDQVFVIGAQVIRFAKAGSGELGLTTDLNEAVPFFRRRRLWREMLEHGLRVRGFWIPRWAVGAAALLSLAITFGTTIWLAQWLDEEHPIKDSSAWVRILAKILVRGGFFALLAGSMMVCMLILFRFFPEFGKEYRTIGHVAALTGGNPNYKQPREEWTANGVWREVRVIVGRELRIEPHLLELTARCE